MSRRVRSFLLAAVAASSLPLTAPAQALLEPQWDCGYVLVRDLFTSSTSTWIGMQYAYILGIPGVHTDARVTCWNQYDDVYTGSVTGGQGTNPTNSYGDPYWPSEGNVVQGSAITCTGQPPLTGDACVEPFDFWHFPPDADHWLCWHVRWHDMATGQTVTRHSSPCQPT